jgi:hypothetical protein
MCKFTINNEKHINPKAYRFLAFSKYFSIKYIVKVIKENVTNCALAAKYGCINIIAIIVKIADTGAFLDNLLEVK